jgi:acetylornithine deacetylase/succinyl-diaminopimelate desuccinylase-like protein
MTHLFENGFQPRRSVILSHGFDEEEVFARRGQGHIAPFLEERYGKDGLLMVIDEGSGATNDVRSLNIVKADSRSSMVRLLPSLQWARRGTWTLS